MESMVFDKLSNAKISNGPEIRGRKEPLMARGGKREGGGRRMARRMSDQLIQI